MCYRVECRQCGKYSWGGCGKHLATLHASIEQGNHCMCRSWPGVVLPPAAESATLQPPLPTTSTSTITTTTTTTTVNATS